MNIVSLFREGESSILRESLQRLQADFHRLEPSAVRQRLEILGERIALCKTADAKSLQREWNHLHFRHAFPVAEDLNPHSPTDNVYKGMKEEIRNEKDPAEKERLAQQLASLRRQCRAARQIFDGKGLAPLRSLEPDVRRRIQERLFEHFLGVPLEEVLQKEGGEEVIAHAVMASLWDRISQ